MKTCPNTLKIYFKTQRLGRLKIKEKNKDHLTFHKFFKNV